MSHKPAAVPLIAASIHDIKHSLSAVSSTTRQGACAKSHSRSVISMQVHWQAQQAAQQKADQQIAAPPGAGQRLWGTRQQIRQLLTSTNNITRCQSASSSSLRDIQLVWDTDDLSKVSMQVHWQATANGRPPRVETEAASYSSCGKHHHQPLTSIASSQHCKATLKC